MFAFSRLFKSDVNAALVDAGIVSDAVNGRINRLFAGQLAESYAIDLPSKPAKAGEFINAMLASPTLVKVTKGTGANGASAEVAQALHALLGMLHVKVASVPAPLPLPAWACPDQLKAAFEARSQKSKAAAAKRKADAEAVEAENAKLRASVALTAQAEASDVTDDDTEQAIQAMMVQAGEAPFDADLPGAEVSAARTDSVALSSAVSLVLAAAKSGALTEAQLSELRAVLEIAQSAPVAPKARKSRKAATAA